LVEKQDSTKKLSDKFCFWQAQFAQMRDEFLEGFAAGLYDIIFNGVPLCAGLVFSYTLAYGGCFVRPL